jgi:hypothetical protein
LEGAPEKIGGDFNCSHNKLTSLEGAPEEIGGNFNCTYNNSLTSLNGAPKKINGNFYYNGKFDKQEIKRYLNFIKNK